MRAVFFIALQKSLEACTPGRAPTTAESVFRVRLLELLESGLTRCAISALLVWTGHAYATEPIIAAAADLKSARSKSSIISPDKMTELGLTLFDFNQAGHSP